MADDTEAGWEPVGPRRGRRRRWAYAALLAVLALVAGAMSSLPATDGDEGLPVDAASGPASPAKTVWDDASRWTAHPALDHAHAVAPTGDGGAWAGTRSGGLVRWDADGQHHQRHTPFDEQGRVTAVAVADDGTVWAANATGREPPSGHGVARFDGDAWTTYTEADGLAHDAVNGLAVDPDGAVWAATAGGVSRFDDGEWRTYADGLPQQRARAVAVGDDGTVWVRTRASPWLDEPAGGVARFDGDAWRGWTTDASLPGDEVAALATGPDGAVWIAAQRWVDEGTGRDEPRLLRFDADRQAWVTAAANAELPLASVQALALDGDGRPWAAPWSVGADAGRVARFAEGRWQAFTTADGLPAGLVESLAVDGRDAVWAATSGGVARFRGDGRWAVHATGKGPIHGDVTSVATGANGPLWAATKHGLSRYDGQAWADWTAADGLAGNAVTAVDATPDGSVWAATANGVSRFDGQTWTSWTGDDGPGPVVSLTVAGDGTVWGVTAPMAGPPHWGTDPDSSPEGQRRLVRFDGRGWRGWPLDDALAGRQPTAVAVDADGIVWIGTRRPFKVGVREPDDDSRLIRFDHGEWDAVTTAEGLPAGAVSDVAVDADNRTWAATTEGVARFDGRRWATRASKGDPLALDDAHPAATSRIRAVAPADDGVLWAATDSGLLRFDGNEWVVTGHGGGRTTSLAVDDHGVWVGTSTGIRRLDTTQP